MGKLTRIPVMIFMVTFLLIFCSIFPAAAQEPSSRCGLVTLNEKPLTLAGAELKTGDEAPPFNILDEETNPVSHEDFKEKIKIISVMPSIDTPT